MLGTSSNDLFQKEPLLSETQINKHEEDQNVTAVILQRTFTAKTKLFKRRIWETKIEALWAIFGLMLVVLPEMYNTILIANYGNIEDIAGVGLGVMLINMFIYGVYEGLNGAIDTLVSQGYGAKDYYLCNVIFNKARMINTLLFIPIAVTLYYSDIILEMLSQPVNVSIHSQIYVLHQIPGLFILMHFQTLKRYLQAQGIFDIQIKVLIFTFIFHCITVTTVMYIAQTNAIVVISSLTNLTFLLNYYLLKYLSSDMTESTWYLSVFHQAFTGWYDYLVLALPCAFIICAEWWMFEVLAVFAGWLGVVYIATLIIIFNTHALFYDISYGLSQAASSQIGRTLAEIGKKTAKKLLNIIGFIQL